MRRICLIIFALLMVVTVLVSCGKNKNDILKSGDMFTVTGKVEYSDEPSDIGQEYCSIKGSKKIEYLFVDIYGEEAKWSSETFFTRGTDTNLLKEYVGQEITVSGCFATEVHGIPYITNITVK